jgi:hypothetical protein
MSETAAARDHSRAVGAPVDYLIAAQATRPPAPPIGWGDYFTVIVIFCDMRALGL